MNKYMKRAGALACIVAMGIALTGCVESARYEESDFTRKNMANSNDAIGMPNIANFFEKKTLKEIYELRDRSDLINYAYIRSDMTGKFIYLGQCVGYGIPYTTQYTSPDVNVGSNGAVVSQADPNGLYTNGATDATWVILIGDDGSREIAYVESDLAVTQNKLPKRLIETWSLPENY